MAGYGHRHCLEVVDHANLRARVALDPQGSYCRLARGLQYVCGNDIDRCLSIWTAHQKRCSSAMAVEMTL